MKTRNSILQIQGEGVPSNFKGTSTHFYKSETENGGGGRPYFDDSSTLCYKKLKIVEREDVVHQTLGRSSTFQKRCPNFLAISNTESDSS